jgi:cytochrome c-type biogenesis protein CcmH/NrfG
MNMEKAAHNSSHAQDSWTSLQAYGLAAFCLVLGVTLGYLFRGSASPAAAAATTTVGPADTSAQGASPHDPAQIKAMLDKATAPLLEALKKDPNDFTSLVALANVYYDVQQYPQAIQYYERAERVQPGNADVVTDLGTAYWYTGDADKAIINFQRSLKIRPNHPGTLFNLGIVQWQGKQDPSAAVTAWEQLLKSNPDYPERQQIQDFISKAKQHMKG